MSIKLSETQDAAVREVAELGYTMAKANTIKSLETTLGLIEQTGPTHHKLTNAGREYLGLPAAEPEENFHQKLMEDVAELEALLEPVGTYVDKPLADWERELLYPALTTPEEVKEDQEEAWKSYSENLRQWGDDITADEPYLEFQADKFDNSLPDAVKVNLGFAATLDWRKTKVWHGLTAQEIRDDMDTRVPANRKDKRAARKADRKARKALLDMIAS